jgi:hypothetical protein
MYENWVLSIVETLKTHSEFSSSTSRTPIDPKQQLKLMIDTYTRFQCNTEDNYSQYLSQRDKFKVNAIAPVFSHNFSVMTVKDRKRVLGDFIEYVHRGNFAGGIEQTSRSIYDQPNTYNRHQDTGKIKVFIPTLKFASSPRPSNSPISSSRTIQQQQQSSHRPSSALTPRRPPPKQPDKSPPKSRQKRKYKKS